MEYLKHNTPDTCDGIDSGNHVLRFEGDGIFWCDACGRQYKLEDEVLVPYGQSQEAQDEYDSVP